MTRRNPALPGVCGITGEDLDALDQGRTTLQSIADRVGCSKQAVSRKVRAMRAASPTGPSVPITPTAAPIVSTGPSSIPTGPVMIDAHQAAVSVNLGVLWRAAGILEGPDALGPSAVKALAGAVASARAELALLGVLAPDDAEIPTELVVRVMTPEEHIAQKLKSAEKDDFEE
jgi:hypothetical protein